MKTITTILVFVICLSCAVNACAQQETTIQKEYLNEIHDLAQSGGYDYITMLPSASLSKMPQVTDHQLKTSSWRDKADLFALKWGVTYKITDGYLLVGPQYINNVTPPKSQITEIDALNKSSLNFLGSLSSNQLELLKTTHKILFSQLTSSQIVLLNAMIDTVKRQIDQFNKISITRSRDKTIKISQKTEGYIKILNLPNVIVFSNGRFLGVLTPMSDNNYKFFAVQNLISGVHSNKIKQKNPTASPQQELRLSMHTLVMSDFLLTLNHGFYPQSQIILKPSIKNSQRRIYSSVLTLPAQVALKFVEYSLGLDFRHISDLTYVKYGKDLLSKSQIKMSLKDNQDFEQEVGKTLQLATLIDASSQKLWNTDPELFLSGRPYYRVELSQDTIDRFGGFNARLKEILENSPKVALGVSQSFVIAVADKSSNKNNTAIPVGVASSKPLDQLAFQKLPKEAK